MGMIVQRQVTLAHKGRVVEIRYYPKEKEYSVQLVATLADTHRVADAKDAVAYALDHLGTTADKVDFKCHRQCRIGIRNMFPSPTLDEIFFMLKRGA